MNSFQKFKQNIKLFSQLLSFSTLSWQQLSKNEKWKAYKDASFFKMQLYLCTNCVLGSLAIQFLFPYLPNVIFKGSFLSALGCMALCYLIERAGMITMIILTAVIFARKNKRSPEYLEYKQKRGEILSARSSYSPDAQTTEEVLRKLKELEDWYKTKKTTKSEVPKQLNIFVHVFGFLLIPFSLFIVSQIYHGLIFTSSIGLLSASLALYLLQKLLQQVLQSKNINKLEQTDIDKLAINSANNPEFRNKVMKIFIRKDIEI